GAGGLGPAEPAGPSGTHSALRGPIRAPRTVRTPEKFDWTSTPSVHGAPPASHSRLEAVPIPALNPSAEVPVPAPTAPSATVPSRAADNAASTCSSVTGRALMSDR